MDIEIGDALSRTSMQKMSDNISDARSYAKSVGESVALPDVIRTWDRTLPTDNNLFSARRSQREFISKNSPDRAKKKIILTRVSMPVISLPEPREVLSMAKAMQNFCPLLCACC